MKKFTTSILALFMLAFAAIELQAQPFWTEDFDAQLPAEWTAIKAQGNNTPSSNWVWTNTGSAGPFNLT